MNVYHIISNTGSDDKRTFEIGDKCTDSKILRFGGITGLIAN